MKDFFVSYNRADKQWAEWIAWTLEEAGYSVVIQAWDFRPGGNFVLDMQRAAAESQKTIAVLSNTYLASAYTQPEWAAAFANDPQAIERKLIPVRVKECQPSGMLRPLVYVDLVGVAETEAKQRLLDAMKERVKPEKKPDFPTDIESVEQPVTQPTAFPRTAASSKPSALVKLNEKKIQNLEKQLAALEENWDDLSEQLNFTENAASRNNLKRQIESVEAEMAKVATELDSLRD